jgi:RNA-directed DNA polymerase
MFKAMSMLNARRQKSAQAERVGVAHGEAGRDPVSGEAGDPRQDTESTGSGLLQAALTRENLRQAWKRVKANKGAAGADGLDIEQTGRHLVTAWPMIRDQLLQGKYRPSPVRRVTIPKPDGGERELGIPTVTDRLIQQALLQVLQPILGRQADGDVQATGEATDPALGRAQHGGGYRQA